MSSIDRTAIVREEFTRQTDAYASAVVITDQDRLGRLVPAIAPEGDQRAIEIATGPGYVALALAALIWRKLGLECGSRQ
jgi:protein-L-isoaspartate O-methyltransferase